VLPFALPDIDDDDIAGVVEVLQSRWLTTGPRVKEFEAQFAACLGVKHAVALNSGTAALHLALDAMGLGEGDEVILPTLTFTACGESVRYFNATPVLADVDPLTLCISPDSIRAAITPRTRAIIAVHLGGLAADMDAISAIAAEHDLTVIEDAAHAFPSTFHGRNVGTMGDMAAFSFYATKTIATGEGGMLVTNDDDWADRARVMGLHGMSRDAWKRYTAGGNWRYDVIAPGYKYNMTDMAAALGLSQLRKVGTMHEKRRRIAERYNQAFGAHAELQTPVAPESDTHAWHLYILRLNHDRLQINRDQFIVELSERGISTSVHFIPLHTFTYYREQYGYADDSFPVASHEFARMFSLPIYSAMSDDDVEDVIGVVCDTVERHSKR
jgi:perosamine synthetase